MPRYCAVKVCRNRGGSASRQDNKRISFYPFPLQDKPRLQKWVDNMKRAEWTPSRHQYLCSEHFTDDCFDIRWGIRYLKNTAIPTIFPSVEDGGEKKATNIKASSKIKPNTPDINTETKGFDSPLSKRPLILSRTCKKAPPSAANGAVEEHTEMVFEVPLVSEIQTRACEITGDTGMPAASCPELNPNNEPHSKELSDSAVTVLCCEALGPLSDGEANVDAVALQAALGQTFSLVPVEMVKDKPIGCFLEETGPGDGEHISVYEHSYCRPDTDKDELWSKILSLHAKILELDRREENTMSKIRALENEITLLKRDGAVFKEKQKVLEDCISSVLL